MMKFFTLFNDIINDNKILATVILTVMIQWNLGYTTMTRDKIHDFRLESFNKINDLSSKLNNIDYRLNNIDFKTSKYGKVIEELKLENKNNKKQLYYLKEKLDLLKFHRLNLDLDAFQNKLNFFNNSQYYY